MLHRERGDADLVVGIAREQEHGAFRRAHLFHEFLVAIDRLLSSPVGFFGIHEEYRNELGFAQLEGQRALALAPSQYLDVDVGEVEPVKCLKSGLWLCLHGELPYALVLARFREYSPEPLLRVEIAYPPAMSVRNSPSVALRNWKRPCVRRAPIAARSCPLMTTTTIAVGRPASWCTGFLPCTARKSS